MGRHVALPAPPTAAGSSIHEDGGLRKLGGRLLVPSVGLEAGDGPNAEAPAPDTEHGAVPDTAVLLHGTVEPTEDELQRDRGEVPLEEISGRCRVRATPPLLAAVRADEAEAKRIEKIWHTDGGSLAVYQKMIHHMDEGIGQVLAALPDPQNTLVVFTSDNGGERFSDTWPLVGKKIYGAWSSAANNLPQFLKVFEPQLKSFSKYILSAAASTAGGLFMFLGSLIISPHVFSKPSCFEILIFHPGISGTWKK